MAILILVLVIRHPILSSTMYGTRHKYTCTSPRHSQKEENLIVIFFLYFALLTNSNRHPLTVMYISAIPIIIIISMLFHWSTAKNQYRKFEKNIPRKGIPWPQSQFPQSCVCGRFIYSHHRSAYSAAGKYADHSMGIYKSLTDT